MKRRDVVRGGLGLITLGAVGPSWAAKPCPPDLDGALKASCGAPGGTGSGPIETAANSMASNTWLQLPDNGLTSLAIKADEPGIGLLFNFSHHLFWNSNAKELHFRGGVKSTGGASGSQRHVRFSDAAGTWDSVQPWGFVNWVHEWGHLCGDPRTGDLYYRRPGTAEIWKWEYTRYPGTGSWTLHSTATFNPTLNAQPLGFFPDLNDGVGGLVHMNTRASDAADIYATTDAAFSSWTSLASSVFGPLTVEGIVVYLPGQKWMLFGGGDGAFQGPSNKKIGKVEADGTVSQLNDLPFDVGANDNGTIVGHPNGRVFGLDPSASTTLYEYDEGGDSWSAAGLTQPTFTRGDMNAACMIPEFDVIFFVSTNNTSTSQWLYKL